ncbi:MAG TPA: hypothetical protein VGA23_09315 [Methylomirabilota bacterium]
MSISPARLDPGRGHRPGGLRHRARPRRLHLWLPVALTVAAILLLVGAVIVFAAFDRRADRADL